MGRAWVVNIVTWAAWVGCGSQDTRCCHSIPLNEQRGARGSKSQGALSTPGHLPTWNSLQATGRARMDSTCRTCSLKHPYGHTQVGYRAPERAPETRLTLISAARQALRYQLASLLDPSALEPISPMSEPIPGMLSSLDPSRPIRRWLRRRDFRSA
jgi:hypothetical protein